jgi:hypothetical protein
MRRPKWVNDRYYCAFVVPPWCPDQEQLQAFADPEQSLHNQNMHPLVTFDEWDPAGLGQAAQAQPFSGASSTGPDWTTEGHFPSTTHSGDVSQLLSMQL